VFIFLTIIHIFVFFYILLFVRELTSHAQIEQNPSTAEVNQNVIVDEDGQPDSGSVDSNQGEIF
jgi:hypothetical protein